MDSYNPPPAYFTLMQQKYECLRYRPCMNRTIRLARWRPRNEWSDESSESEEGNNHKGGNGTGQEANPDAKRFKPNDGSKSHNAKKLTAAIHAGATLEDVEEDEPMKKVSAWLAMQNNNAVPAAATPAPIAAVVTDDIPDPEKQAKLTELSQEARKLDKIKSLMAYVDDDDRSKLVQEAFASVNDRILFHLVPDLLKDELSLAELRKRCSEQLDKWPTQRIQHILGGMTLTDVLRLEDLEPRKILPDAGQAAVSINLRQSSKTNESYRRQRSASRIHGMPSLPADLFNDTEQILFELLQLAEDSEPRNNRRSRSRSTPTGRHDTAKVSTDLIGGLFDDADDVLKELEMMQTMPDNDGFDTNSASDNSSDSPDVHAAQENKTVAPAHVAADSIQREIELLRLKQEILQGMLGSNKPPPVQVSRRAAKTKSPKPVSRQKKSDKKRHVIADAVPELHILSTSDDAIAADLAELLA